MEDWSGRLRLVETIPIPTEGYIDHLSYDLKNQHLFISGENNKKLVVVDMKAGKVIHETPLGGNPRKPFFDAPTNGLWLAPRAQPPPALPPPTSQTPNA